MKRFSDGRSSLRVCSHLEPAFWQSILTHCHPKSPFIIPHGIYAVVGFPGRAGGIIYTCTRGARLLQEALNTLLLYTRKKKSSVFNGGNNKPKRTQTKFTGEKKPRIINDDVFELVCVQQYERLGACQRKSECLTLQDRMHPLYFKYLY